MSVATRQSYEDTLTALGICVSARIPVLLWGPPGTGKTSVVEAARNSGWHVESLIISHYEPSDFTGLPVIAPNGTVTMAPPQWAKRLADHEGPAIGFFDEFSTASPALQAAALRPLTHYEVGALQLPETVSWVAAANPADIAVSGWELAAPTANRFVHLEFDLPLEVFAEASVTGQWPVMPVFDRPDELEAAVSNEAVLVSGFLRARQSQLSQMPDDPAARGRAFPTPRTWTNATRLASFAAAVGGAPSVTRLLVAGCIGDATAHEYLNWRAHLDLPDAEMVLADPHSVDWKKLRPDRVYVVLQSLLAVIAANTSAHRWEVAILACCLAAEGSGLDPAVPVVRSLLRDGMRPADASLPAGIAVFAPALALAGLLDSAA